MASKAKADAVAAVLEPTGAATPAEPVELQAVEPLRLDGVDIAIGALFTTSPAQADQLVLAGVACLPLPPVLPE